MFDIGWQELFLIGALALIVVGPKDLPGAIRAITKYVGKARSMMREFQSGVNEVVREAELQDLKDTVKGEIDKVAEDHRDIGKGFDLGELESGHVGPVPVKKVEAGAANQSMDDTSEMMMDDDDIDAQGAAAAEQGAAAADTPVETAEQPLDDDVMPVPSAKPKATKNG